MISSQEAIVAHDDPRLAELHAAAKAFIVIAEGQRSDRNDDPEQMRAETVHWAMTAMLNEANVNADLALSICAALMGCAVSGYEDPAEALQIALERTTGYFHEAMLRRAFADQPAEGRA